MSRLSDSGIDSARAVDGDGAADTGLSGQPGGSAVHPSGHLERATESRKGRHGCEIEDVNEPKSPHTLC